MMRQCWKCKKMFKGQKKYLNICPHCINTDDKYEVREKKRAGIYKGKELN